MVRLRDLRSGWEIDMTIKVLGIDIAKNTFQLQGADDAGKAVKLTLSKPHNLCVSNS